MPCWQGRNSCPWHSRPQRPRSFWSAPRIATSGPVQRHSVFEWLWKHNRSRLEPIRFVRLHSEHAQSDGKSVNRGLPVLDQARGRDSWCWPKGARPLGTRMLSIAASARVIWLCACVRYWPDRGLVFKCGSCFYCCCKLLKPFNRDAALLRNKSPPCLMFVRKSAIQHTSYVVLRMH